MYGRGREALLSQIILFAFEIFSKENLMYLKLYHQGTRIYSDLKWSLKRVRIK